MFHKIIRLVTTCVCISDTNIVTSWNCVWTQTCCDLFMAINTYETRFLFKALQWPENAGYSCLIIVIYIKCYKCTQGQSECILCWDSYNHGTLSPYKNWQILVFRLVFEVSCVSVRCVLVIGLENFPLRNHSLIAAHSYVKPSVTKFQ